MDDVQFLAGRDKTAEEFFHTFNALHEHEVQIVLSSDWSPKELKGLEDRLCSRFEWGMRVQIDVPEFETRAAILQKKAQVERIELPHRSPPCSPRTSSRTCASSRGRSCGWPPSHP